MGRDDNGRCESSRRGKASGARAGKAASPRRVHRRTRSCEQGGKAVDGGERGLQGKRIREVTLKTQNSTRFMCMRMRRCM